MDWWVTKAVKVPAVHTVVVAAPTATAFPADPTATASANSGQAQDPNSGVVVTASDLHQDSGGD